MFALLSGLVLTTVALTILAYLGALLVGAMRLPVRQAIESRRLARHLARARTSDGCLARGDIDAALQEIHAAFYLVPLQQRDLAAAVANHHTALLSRLLALASDGAGDGVRLLSLAKTDRLLHERTGLQRTFFAVHQGNDRKRQRAVEADLTRNADELRRTLQLLIGEVRATHMPRRLH